MAYDDQISKRVNELASAFDRDGFEIIKGFTLSGRLGIAAEHKTAKNYDTGQKKKTYYVEGSPYEMGYLVGLLAEPEVSDMAIHFKDNIIFDFFGLEFLNKSELLKKSILSFLYESAEKTYHDLPIEYRDEITGIYEGCKQSNPGTKVNMEHLILLNVGVDVLCAFIYTSPFLQQKFPTLQSDDIKLCMMCNAFSVSGHEAGNGHYFGRDFMFATAGVLQNNIAHIIYNPINEQKRNPFVSVTALGMVGSIAAMNIHGVAAGVDMSPSAACNPKKVGINSLLLTRLCVEQGADAQEAVNIIASAQRGVSWAYAISDGKNDRSCTVEAVASSNSIDFLQYPPLLMKTLLPDSNFLKTHTSAAFDNGIMVRWNDYPYPAEYLKFNEGLWKYNKTVLGTKIALYPDSFGAEGYINKKYTDHNCPSLYYFAPLRVEQSSLVITTNHFIIPEMRLCAMQPWTAMIVSGYTNDIQWRYDELNHQIQEALQEKGVIDYNTAKRLIDFLAPYGRFPAYYAQNSKSKDGKQIQINGSTSLFDLKVKSVESHFGYYCDEWVKVVLPNYFK